MTDEALRFVAERLRAASNRPLDHAMADVVEMAVTHRDDADGCFLCESDLRGECIAWCNGVLLAMAWEREHERSPEVV
jgi:isoaspartyl peptidase/L-asparaginase-like protein (Ntn-hydrolase superfamily)